MSDATPPYIQLHHEKVSAQAIVRDIDLQLSSETLTFGSVTVRKAGTFGAKNQAEADAFEEISAALRKYADAMQRRAAHIDGLLVLADGLLEGATK